MLDHIPVYLDYRNRTFQVPMRYCSLQYWILLSSADTSTAEHRFCVGPAASSFLGLLVVVLRSSQVAYWTPSDLGDSSFGVMSCPFTHSWGSHSRCTGVVCHPPPVDHVLSELSTMAHLSWVALHGPAHSFIELCEKTAFLSQSWRIHDDPLLALYCRHLWWS